MCINTNCARKVHIVPGHSVVQCMSCIRKMLARKCTMVINYNVDIAQAGLENTLTTFGAGLVKCFN